MFEKPQNLRDALELIRMLEHLFGSVSRTNDQVPWRGVELTLRQIALSILDSLEECTSGGYAGQPAASYAKKSSDSQAAQADEKDSSDTGPGRFRSRPTVVDRVQTSPVSGYKSKNFVQE